MAEVPSGTSHSASSTPRRPEILGLAGVSKAFNDVPVLRGVDLTVAGGTVHGLVGNNGAGKSTLVKIITGSYTAGPGSEIRINGGQVPTPYTTHVAGQLGIRVVHQEAPLIPSFTIEEMVGIFHTYPKRLGTVRWRELRRRTRHLLERFDIQARPDTPTALLGAAQRALVTLAIALADVEESGVDPLVILDEATASVPSEEAAVYLERVKKVADRGGAVLMVTHRLHEVVTYCDTVTVLSDGRVVYDGPVGDMSVRELSDLMKGTEPGPAAWAGTRQVRDVSLPITWGFAAAREGVGDRPPVLSVRDLHGSLVDGVSFDIAPGEIVGMCGLFGSGDSQIARIVAGVERATGGTISLDGEPLAQRGTPGKALAAGIAYLSSDRSREGGVGTLSVQENTVLPSVARFWARTASERARVHEAIALFDIRPGRRDAPFGVLSGGNQQKVLVAKILLTNPRVVVLDDPTVGVDPQSREIIFSVLREVVATGRGALVVSSEPDQLAAVCDRLLVIEHGRIARELTGAELAHADVALASSL